MALLGIHFSNFCPGFLTNQVGMSEQVCLMQLTALNIDASLNTLIHDYCIVINFLYCIGHSCSKEVLDILAGTVQSGFDLTFQK